MPKPRAWYLDKDNQAAVVRLARESPANNQRSIGARLGVSQGLVQRALALALTKQELADIVSASRSFHKSKERHPGWRGESTASDRLNFSRHLGIQLPSSICVHHIDEDIDNHSVHNMALVTKAGHARIHTLNGTLHEWFGKFIDHDLVKLGPPIVSADAVRAMEKLVGSDLPPQIVVAHLNGDTSDLSSRNLVGSTRLGLRRIKKRMSSCES